MDRGLVIWDRQHAGKRSRPSDMGAAADVDQDGQVEVWEREAELTPSYIGPGLSQVRELGADAHLIDPLGAGLQADYPPRHAQAAHLAQPRLWAAYLACHLNAGAGNYGLVGYDPDSPGGRLLAQHIADELERSIPVISRCRVEALTGRWARGLPTIQGILRGPQQLSGVLVEPLFIDAPEHQAYMTAGGLVEVGRALARGAVAWGWRGGRA